MNEPTPSTDTPAPEVSDIAKRAANDILAQLEPTFAEWLDRDGSVAIVVQRAIDESAKATPAPSLTGEEVSDEARLLPCPFCDAKAVLVEFYKRIAVNCENPNCWAQQKGPKETLPLIIAAWNNRATARAQDKAALSEIQQDQSDSAIEFQSVLNALRAENERLKEQLNNSVPRSRWESAEKDLIEAGAKREEIVANATREIESRDKEVARLKAEVEGLKKGFDNCHDELVKRTTERNEVISSRGDFIKAGLSTLSDLNRIEKERDDLRARLAQAEKERDESKTKCKETAKDFEAAFRLVRIENDELTAARDLAQQRERELDSKLVIEKANYQRAVRVSSCPAGTDLAAWVGKLSEDKQRLLDCVKTDSDILEILHSRHGHEGDYQTDQCMTCRRMKENRSAIDASNPKTE